MLSNFFWTAVFVGSAAFIVRKDLSRVVSVLKRPTQRFVRDVKAEMDKKGTKVRTAASSVCLSVFVCLCHASVSVVFLSVSLCLSIFPCFCISVSIPFLSRLLCLNVCVSISASLSLCLLVFVCVDFYTAFDAADNILTRP